MFKTILSPCVAVILHSQNSPSAAGEDEGKSGDVILPDASCIVCPHSGLEDEKKTGKKQSRKRAVNGMIKQ